MTKQPIMLVVLVIATPGLITSGISAHGSEAGSRSRTQVRLTGWSKPSSVDLTPYNGGKCCRLHVPCLECIERVPVQKCVTGKKKVYDLQNSVRIRLGSGSPLPLEKQMGHQGNPRRLLQTDLQEGRRATLLRSGTLGQTGTGVRHDTALPIDRTEARTGEFQIL